MHEVNTVPCIILIMILSTKNKQTDYKIMHMQTIDHAYFRHLTRDNNDTKAISWFSVLSEIVEIIARSSDILCILWTKVKSLLHDLRITAGLGGCVPPSLCSTA